MHDVQRYLRKEPALGTIPVCLGKRGGFLKSRDREPGAAEPAGKRRERAMVRDRPAGLTFRDPPRDPDLPFVPVGAHLPPDEIVPGTVPFPGALDDPTGALVKVEARMREGEDETAPGFDQPRRLPDRSLTVWHVLNRHVRDDQIERSALEAHEMGGIRLEEPGPGATALLPTASEGERRLRSVDAHGHTGPLPGPSTREIAVAASEVEDPLAPHRADDPEQRGIDDRAMPEVPPLSHP